MLDHVHGTDESIGVKSLVSGTKIMLALAYDHACGEVGATLNRC